MPDTVTGFREVRDRLAARFPGRVHEVPGWETRGKGTLTPRGKINHHDAIPGPSPTAGLRICTYGREGLRNSLCNFYGERGPKAGIWLVGAKAAWHAGQGVKGTNSTLIGSENANDGRGELWHPDAIEIQLALDVELARVFGLPAEHFWDHKEHTGRKIDRTGINPATWRQQIAAGHRTTEEDDLTDEERTKLFELHGWLFGPEGYLERIDGRLRALEVVFNDAPPGPEGERPNPPGSIRAELDELRRGVRTLLAAAGLSS